MGRRSYWYHQWTGVSLKKVTEYCGGLAEGAKHIEFMGVHTYVKKGHIFNYVVSVPWRKVKAHEVLLAWEMNGKPLPKMYGHPLRAVVYGYIGARYILHQMFIKPQGWSN